MVDADFLSRLENLPNATPSEAADAKPLDQLYPLPYPLNQMQEKFKVTATGRACAMIRPATTDREGDQSTVRPQKCGMVKGCQIKLINSSPPGTMGELQEVPPVIHDDAFHVYELAATQERDPVHCG